MKETARKYLAKVDSRNRLTVRDSKYAFYDVTEFNNGTIILNPRVLNDPNELSENTLEMIEESIKNFKKGVVSNPINLEKYFDTNGKK